MIKNIKLSAKLIGAFLIMAFIALVIGLIGWNGISKTNNAVVRTLRLDGVAKELLQREIDHLKWVSKVSEFQGDKSIKQLEVQKDDHKCAFGKWYYSEERKNAEKEVPEIKTLLEKIEEPHAELHKSAQELENILSEGEEFRGKALNFYQGETIKHLDSVQKILGEIRHKVEEKATEFSKTSEVQSTRTKFITVVAIFIGTFAAIFLGIVFSISITRPINHAIYGLSEAAEQVSSASEQVSSTSQQLAEGATEQAAFIEETSSSLEEISSMTKQNADNAKEADSLMRKTNQVVEQANGSMTELTSSMEEISRASEDISKIIKTIDEIAFQTNLLALNAAVEAARAGEAGSGFAVVADEVRNLAMRTAESAKNTADLIENTVNKVKDGSDVVSKTNDAFSEVAQNVIKVSKLVGEIAEAGSEQAIGIEQINKTVAEMDRIVQQSAVNSEETASASEEMNAQAKQMKDNIYGLVSLVGSYEKQNGSGFQAYPNTEPVVKKLKKGAKNTFDHATVAKPAQIIPMDEGDFKDF